MKPYTVIGQYLTCDTVNPPFNEHVMALNPVHACFVAVHKLNPDGVPDNCDIFEDMAIIDVLEGHHDSVAPNFQNEKLDISREDAPQYIGICPSLDQTIERKLRK